MAGAGEFVVRGLIHVAFAAIGDDGSGAEGVGDLLFGADTPDFGPDHVPASDVVVSSDGTGYPKDGGYDNYLKGKGGLSPNSPHAH